MEQIGFFSNLVSGVLQNYHKHMEILQTSTEEEDINDEHLLLHPECELTIDTEEVKLQNEASQFSVSTNSHHQDTVLCNCDGCGKVCFTDSNCCNSQKFVHLLQTCVCDICGEAYRSTWELEVHLQSHTEERPYECSTCGKCFMTRRSLCAHLKCHFGEKRHTCSICDKAFHNRSCLVRHLKVHSGEKPFSCTLCNKAFALKKGLAKHSRVHTREKPYPCNECGRAFADKWHLTQHIRLHTGERPYVCPHCTVAFTHNVSLKEHIRQHTGELWKCELCGKTYMSRSSLTAHCRNMHA